MQSKISLLLGSDYNSLTVEAQKDVYLDFYKFAYGPIMYMVKEHGATEDIIQESFLKVIKNVPALDNENQLKAWIRVVVKNTTYNYLKKHQKNRNNVDAESVFLYEDPEFATSSETLQNEVEAKIMAEAITKYLQELKPEYRVLIELRWQQKLSYKEIANYLGTNEQTVKYKLQRARESIKKRFLKDWGDSG